jgi:DNA-binding ferritin-like protein
MPKNLGNDQADLFDPLENDPPYLPERPRTKTANAADVFTQICQRFGDLPMVELGALVAILRAASIVHQSHHWQTSGPTYYGDHLMFERIYGDSQVFIDQVAEKTMGMGGHTDLLCPKTQTSVMGALTNLWCQTIIPKAFDRLVPLGATEMVNISLGVEQCVLGCLKAAKESLESKGDLSEGTDNLLQGIIDKHEEFVYLLQQRQGGKVASYKRSVKDLL